LQFNPLQIQQEFSVPDFSIRVYPQQLPSKSCFGRSCGKKKGCHFASLTLSLFSVRFAHVVIVKHFQLENKKQRQPRQPDNNDNLTTTTTRQQRQPDNTLYPMHSPEIKEFIRRHSALFWYIPEDKKEEISEEFLVETILNYGDMESVKDLMRLLGKQRLSKIFFTSIRQSERRKSNYNELALNYFNLLLGKHAS
jgi:hypothetical protein